MDKGGVQAWLYVGQVSKTIPAGFQQQVFTGSSISSRRDNYKNSLKTFAITKLFGSENKILYMIQLC